MRVLAVFAIVCLLALARFGASPALAGADDDRSRHVRAARVALANGDHEQAHMHLAAVDSIVGGHAGALRALASLAAAHGDSVGALDALRAFAAMGIASEVRRDTSFAAFVDHRGFEAIAARIDSGAAPLARATLVASLGDAGLLAEDIAWDARRRRFLVSSIHRRKIIAIDASGNTSDFVPSGRDGLWGVYALALDVARDRLWCTTAAGPEIEGFDPADSGRTALCSFSLRTGVQLTRIELPRDHEPHVLGDMTLGPDGRVYLTDSRAGGVYRFRPGAATLDTLAPSGTFASPQAPLVAPDSRRLLVPDYPRGIAALDLATGHVSWLAKPRSLASGGIDGLSRSGARLIAIQNGITPHRVVELALDAGATRIESWRVLEQGSEWLGEPNHGVFAGRDFVFIGNSGWDRVGDDGTFRTLPADRPPVLLRLARALR